ncbi:MAG TPA: hypothetical protein DCM14_02670 [Clostridiales bacterium UBA8153]|nr:hypothetical protein [Clostridiales bacterium UBA8153]
MDASALAGIVWELGQQAGARLERICQPSPSELYLFLRKAGEVKRLCLGMRSDLPRLHFTASRPENPAHPPAFCMLLRKWLEGARLTGVEQPPGERWVCLRFRGRSSLGQELALGLVAELIPGATNLILLRLPEQQVLAALKPGAVLYQPPALPGGVSPGRWLPELFADGRQDPGPAWQMLLSTVRGFGPLLAKEVVFRSGWDADAPAQLVAPQADRLARFVHDLAGAVSAGRFQPAVYYGREGKPRYWHVLELTHLSDLVAVSMATPSAAADHFYTAYLQGAAFTSRRSGLRGALSSAGKRLERRARAQEADLQQAAVAGEFRLWGELLTTFADRVPVGAGRIDLPNYYLPDSPPVNVPLDPALGARANARRYFARHAKGERTRVAAGKELERTLAELAYLQRVSDTVEDCRTLQDLEEVWEELREAGLAHPVPKSPRAGARSGKFTGLELVSSRGDAILVGKNHHQNEQLVRAARPDQVWLHARGVPGAHVLLCPGAQAGKDWPPADSLEEAAELAAHFSRAGRSRWVEVDWTWARHVRRVPQGRPGLVVYHHEQTIRVSASPRLFAGGNSPPR